MISKIEIILFYRRVTIAIPFSAISRNGIFSSCDILDHLAPSSFIITVAILPWQEQELLPEALDLPLGVSVPSEALDPPKISDLGDSS